MVNAIKGDVLMPSTNYEGLSYPIHFLKRRGSIIRNNFLKCRTKQATLFARCNDFHALFATNKVKHMLNRHFRARVVTQFEVNVLRKVEKSQTFESSPFLY